MVILPVMPRPPAAFSPFTTIKSSPCCSFNSGSRAMTALRPGSPTMSPRKRTVSIEQDRIEEVQNVDGNKMTKLECRMTKEYQSSNDTNTSRDPVAAPRFVIRYSTFLMLWLSILSAAALAADNLGVLGSKPSWSVLEHYQHTITHDEFAHLINDVYCAHGIPDELIKIDNDAAQILTNRE